ncbi:MAG TPA: Spy/CpxP family protein refolding chaperone [Caulobacteraceae bacterium]
MDNHFWRLAGAAAVLALASPALAQQGTPPASPPAGYSSQPPSPADQSDRLRRQLNLRPDQETALQSFVAAMQPKPGEVDRLRAEAQRDAVLPTPQRLDAMLARMDSMRGEVMARINATRVFYAGLTPAQRSVFDQMPSPGR